ncbi:MAG: DUF1501 domain-containing protein [Planctomycetaceae bacterium]
MQLSAGEALDITSETRQTQELYGIGQPTTDSYGKRCLLARRLVERGVRFVQVFLEEQPWDSHVDLEDNHRAICTRTDKPTAGLLRDLKQRGLLDSTLILWGGEFGRTPTSQKSGNIYTGRDHNMQAFTTWMAGGVKGAHLRKHRRLRPCRRRKSGQRTRLSRHYPPSPRVGRPTPVLPPQWTGKNASPE